jgi:hypothetical protein
MKGRLLLAIALCIDAVVVPTGCGAMSLSFDAGVPLTDASADGSFLSDAHIASPHLVVVNGLDKALGALNDTDVRICLGSGPSDRPLPEDPSHPVPLSNYPGIPLGGGVDLGDYPLPQTIYVIAANLQKDNYPGGPAQVGCNEILSTGPTGKPYLTVSVPDAPGPNRLVVLLDDTSDAGATAVATLLDEATYGPSDGGTTVYAQVGAFGPWTTQPITVDVLDSSDASTPLALFDAGSVSPTTSVPVEISPYAGLSLRFSSAGATPGQLVQSFQEIQSVSDPTTSGSVFYGQRANYLFLLLGAPGSADAAAPPPSFEDRGLHIVAIPYVP